jgi:hypothetical protein
MISTQLEAVPSPATSCRWLMHAPAGSCNIPMYQRHHRALGCYYSRQLHISQNTERTHAEPTSALAHLKSSKVTPGTCALKSASYACQNWSTRCWKMLTDSTCTLALNHVSRCVGRQLCLRAHVQRHIPSCCPVAMQYVGDCSCVIGHSCLLPVH